MNLYFFGFYFLFIAKYILSDDILGDNKTSTSYVYEKDNTTFVSKEHDFIDELKEGFLNIIDTFIDIDGNKDNNSLEELFNFMNKKKHKKISKSNLEEYDKEVIEEYINYNINDKLNLQQQAEACILTPEYISKKNVFCELSQSIHRIHPKYFSKNNLYNKHKESNITNTSYNDSNSNLTLSTTAAVVNNFNRNSSNNNLTMQDKKYNKHNYNKKTNYNYRNSNKMPKQSTCYELTKYQEIKLSYIINKYNIKKETVIHQLRFALGICKPIILIGGLYSTKLMIEFQDCDLIQKHHPELYDNCFTKQNKKCIKEEKQIWLSENFMKDDKTTCFSELFSIGIVNNKLDEHYYNKNSTHIRKGKGIKLTYYGDTPNTKSKSNCGLSAASDVLDKFSYFGVRAPVGYRELAEKLIENYGYIPGVNLFGIPHDWRELANNKVNWLMLNKTFELSHLLNGGKKTVVLGHSLGGIIAYDYIYNLNKETKDKYVDTLVTVGTPYLGTVTYLKQFLAGTNNLNRRLGTLFIDFINMHYSLDNQRNLLQRMPQGFMLTPSFFWFHYDNEEWMNTIKGRVFIEDEITNCIETIMMNFAIEKGHRDINIELNDHYLYLECFTKTLSKKGNLDKLNEFQLTFPIFPGIDHICNSKQKRTTFCDNNMKPFFKPCRKTFWDERCRLSFYLPNMKTQLKIKANKLNDKIHNYTFSNNSNINNNDNEETIEYKIKDLDELKQIIQRFSLLGSYNKKYVDWGFESKGNDFNYYNHPEVNLAIYVNNIYPGNDRLEFNFDPRDFTRNYIVDDVFEKLDYTKIGSGDGTVASASLLGTALKWSLNTEYKIELINYCTNGDINNNFGYRQLECHCENQDDEPCDHSGVVSEEYFIKDFIKNYVMDLNLNEHNFVNQNEDVQFEKKKSNGFKIIQEEEINKYNKFYKDLNYTLNKTVLNDKYSECISNNNNNNIKKLSDECEDYITIVKNIDNNVNTTELENNYEIINAVLSNKSDNTYPLSKDSILSIINVDNLKCSNLKSWSDYLEDEQS